MGHFLVIETIIFSLVAGVLCQLLSEKLKIPSIFFLLIFGVALGPELLHLVSPSSISNGLPIIVEIGVAIILFDGGLSLQFDQFRHISKAIQRLLSIGALCTFACVTLATHWIIDLPWRYCFIFGALMIVTGPTVIGPILKRVPLKRRVASILHWESILLDPIGVILAILILDFVLAEESSFFQTILEFFRILITGGLIGLLIGWCLQMLLKHIKAISHENINLMIFAGALLSFQLAQMITENAGLFAVVISGMVLANTAHAYKEVIVEFRETITSLFVAFIFILLASRLQIAEVFGFGMPGWILLGVIIFVIRPLAVYLSTMKADLLRRERLFLSWISPRGIIAASAASLFALIFEGKGDFEAGKLENLTYLVIGVTVTVQGLSAGTVANILGVSEKERSGVLFVGAHPFARAIAKWLKTFDLEVKLVDQDYRNIRIALNEGFEAHHGNALDPFFIENLQIQRIGNLLAMTSNDEVNILASQLGDRLIGPKSSFQLAPGHWKETHEISKTVGGIPILPHLPFLVEINVGFEEGRYDLREMAVPANFEYHGPLQLDDGLFWPLFMYKSKKLRWISAGELFKSEEKVIGLFRKT